MTYAAACSGQYDCLHGVISLRLGNLRSTGRAVSISFEFKQRLPEAGHAATLHGDKWLLALAAKPLCFQRAGMADPVHRHKNGMRGLDQGLE